MPADPVAADELAGAIGDARRAGGRDDTARTPSPHEPDSLVANRGGRLILGGMFALLAVVLIAHSIRFNNLYSPFPTFSRSDGTLQGVLEQKTMARMITFYAGLAARDAAGGTIRELTGPRKLDDLARVEMESSIGAYSGYFLRQMSSMNFLQPRYDPVLPDERIAELTSEHETVEYPMNVVAIVDGEGDGRAALFTDPRHERLYAIPTALVAEEVRP